MDRSGRRDPFQAGMSTVDEQRYRLSEEARTHGVFGSGSLGKAASSSQNAATADSYRSQATSIAAGYHSHQAARNSASGNNPYSHQSAYASTSSPTATASLRRQLVSPSVSLRTTRSAAAIAAAMPMPVPQPLTRRSCRRDSIYGQPASLTGTAPGLETLASHPTSLTSQRSSTRLSCTAPDSHLGHSRSGRATLAHRGSSGMSTSAPSVRLATRSATSGASSSPFPIEAADACLLPPASAALPAGDLTMRASSSGSKSTSLSELRASLATRSRSRRTVSTGSHDHPREVTATMSTLSVAESRTLPPPPGTPQLKPHHRRDSSAPPSSRRIFSGTPSLVASRAAVVSVTEPAPLRTSPAGQKHARSASVAAATSRRDVTVPRLREGYGIAGLANLGNTCFMNSVLQCLGCVPEFVGAMLSGRVVPCADAQVAPAYIEMLQAVSGMTASETFTPSRIRSKMGAKSRCWAAGTQQDSHEFLLALLAVLKVDCDRNTRKPKYRELTGKGSEAEQAREATEYLRLWNDSVVDDVFGGLMQSTIRCKACGHESHCFDACCDLSLSVVDPNECTLTDCLRQFTAEESLDVAYRCEQCTATTKKTKIMRLYTPPTVLIVHLKRFSRPGGDCGESGGGFFARQESFSRMRKNTARVDIPEQLHIVPFCNAARLAETGCRGTYELVAVSHHSGGMGGGHYTATGRAISDARWYCFNDSSVTRSKSPAYGSTSAYVLFYRMMHS